MKRILKWLGIITGGLVALFIIFGIVLSTVGEERLGLPTPTPEPPPTATPTFQSLRTTASTIQYDELLRHMEDHKGKTVYYRGQVGQVEERYSDNQYRLRVNTRQGEYGNWEHDVRVDYEGERVLENDIVEFVGELKGLWTYTAVLGNRRTIPEVKASQLQLVQAR